MATQRNPGQRKAFSFLFRHRFLKVEHGHRRSCQGYSFSAPHQLFTVRAAFDEVATKKATHVWVKPYQGSKDTEGLHQFLFFLKPEATGVNEGVKLREGMEFFDVSATYLVSKSWSWPQRLSLLLVLISVPSVS